MPNAKLLSIITVTLNAGEKIAATLNSVLRQDRSLFTYHILDGGSRDQTLEVIQRAAPDTDVISEPDQGIYDAINKGIARSEGRFLYFLGAGDVLRAGILAHTAKRLANSPPNSVVYGNVHWVSRRRLYDGFFSKRDLTSHGICHQAMFIDRSVFELLGTYDRRYPISADWQFNIRCFSDPRVHVTYIDEVIADYEGGGISETRHDARFEADLPGLIRRSFGTLYGLLLRLHRIRRRVYGIVLRLGGILRPDRSPSREGRTGRVTMLHARLELPHGSAADVAGSRTGACPAPGDGHAEHPLQVPGRTGRDRLPRSHASRRAPADEG